MNTKYERKELISINTLYTLEKYGGQKGNIESVNWRTYEKQNNSVKDTNYDYLPKR